MAQDNVRSATGFWDWKCTKESAKVLLWAAPDILKSCVIATLIGVSFLLGLDFIGVDLS